MTALEIINETVEYYSQDPKRRAFAGDACFYIQEETGNMCAVGRCANNPKELNPECYFECQNLSDEQIFKPEYRGHSVEFWTDLQKLHDNKLHWSESGLSLYGEGVVRTLKEKYFFRN